jgi:hypothetical protein
VRADPEGRHDRVAGEPLDCLAVSLEQRDTWSKNRLTRRRAISWSTCETGAVDSTRLTNSMVASLR